MPIKDGYKCTCKTPTHSSIFIFSAEKCRACGKLIEPMGKAGCGD